jgi:hypothetical protein
LRRRAPPYFDNLSAASSAHFAFSSLSSKSACQNGPPVLQERPTAARVDLSRTVIANQAESL